MNNTANPKHKTAIVPNPKGALPEDREDGVTHHLPAKTRKRDASELDVDIQLLQ